MSDEQVGDGLWSDDAIIRRYLVAFGQPPDVHHMAIMCWMRDDLTAEIAKLRAELAEQGAVWRWMPVEDGEYLADDPNGPIRIEGNGDTKVCPVIWDNEFPTLLEPGMAVCRFVPPAGGGGVMIAIPYSVNFADNLQRKSDADILPCAICGKGVSKPRFWVHVHNGGDDLVSEAEAATLDPASDMGCFPIGGDCLRKHPELRPYVCVEQEATHATN